VQGAKSVGVPADDGPGGAQVGCSQIQLQRGQGGWIRYGWSEREQRVRVQVTRPDTVVTGLGWPEEMRDRHCGGVATCSW
jgi:hypothetical protein